MSRHRRQTRFSPLLANRAEEEGEESMNQNQARATRRIVFVAVPEVEILDLVGPLQVFARAAEFFARKNPGSPPIYSVEIVTTSAQCSLVANCGLQITADKTFRELRG